MRALTMALAIIATVSLGSVFSHANNPMKPLTNRTFDMEVRGKTAYVGVTAGLSIVDITDGGKKELSMVKLPGSVTDVLLHDDLVYVALGPNGVAIVDVTNPSAPLLLSTTMTNGGCFGLYLDAPKELLWIAEGSMGLTGLSVSDPSAPEVVGSLTGLGYVRAMVAEGSRLYLAAGKAQIVVVDVSDPTEPKKIDDMGDIDSGECRFLLIDGTHLYAAMGSAGIAVVEVSPEELEVIGTLDTPDVARGLSKKGSMLYVADGGSGIQIIDVTDPTAPALVASEESKGSSNKVLAMESSLFIANDYFGLTVLPLDDKGLPKPSEGKQEK